MISIVVATFANDEALDRIRNLIKANTFSDYELIVVDNGSQARGCVRAYNQGLRAAEGDALVCINDDCQPQAGWLEPLLAAMDRGVWLCCPQWKYARMAGHCMAFPRAAYELTGGFDQRYVHYCADHHFEMLVARAGKPICQVPESTVLHVADDPLRIHYRKSALLGNHAELPNTGQMYLDDQAVFESIWGEDRAHCYWPPDDAWATDYVWSAS